LKSLGLGLVLYYSIQKDYPYENDAEDEVPDIEGIQKGSKLDKIYVKPFW